MSDFWIMQWAKMREEQMEQEAHRERLARLALARRKHRRRPQGLVKTCLFRLGKVFEASGRFLQERFGPKPAGTCCKC